MRNTFYMKCLFATAALLTLLASCATSTKNKETNTASHTTAKSDTLTVVVSKFYSNRSFRDFFERIAPEVHFNWQEAYTMAFDSVSIAAVQSDGVLLTGGGDIHPGFYGQEADTALCGKIDLWRDEVESKLIWLVTGKALPCLGVCRGMQMINTVYDGSLHPHLPDVLGTNAHRAGVTGNSRDTTHALLVSDAIAVINVPEGHYPKVVSHHHQGINRLADGLVPWAYSEDGLIEAVWMADTTYFPFVVGVQWHPERSSDPFMADSVGMGFVRAMLSEAKRVPKRILDPKLN